MIKLLDPNLTSNQNIAYINVPSYDGCARCDPQQDMISSDCTTMSMDTDMDYSPAALNIAGNLDALVSSLKRLNLGQHGNDRVALEALGQAADSLRGRLPRQLQLEHLRTSLEQSSIGIKALLDEDRKAKSGKDREANLQSAELQVQGLAYAIEKALFARGGKDCRSAEMLIQ